MAPSELLFFPASLSPHSLSLGSLLSAPFTSNPESFLPSQSPPFQTLEDRHVQASYKDTITRASSAPEIQNDAFDVEADEMTYRRLRKVAQAFESLCQNSEALTYISKNARTRQPLYFVTAVQELRNANVTPVNPQDSGDVSPADAYKLSIHTRRDSGLDTAESETSRIFGVEIREIRARIGRPDEPHSLDDIGYLWSYVPLDNDVQLSIGLGHVLSFGSASGERKPDEEQSDWSEDTGYMIELDD